MDDKANDNTLQSYFMPPSKKSRFTESGTTQLPQPTEPQEEPRSTLCSDYAHDAGDVESDESEQGDDAL